MDLVFPLSLLRVTSTARGHHWSISGDINGGTLLIMATILTKARGRGSVAVPPGLHTGFYRILQLLPGQSITLTLHPSLPPTPPQAWLREKWVPCFQRLPWVAAWQPLSGIYSLWWPGLWHLHAPSPPVAGRPHQEMGLNQTHTKGFRITSLVHLVWFLLLKKRPFSEVSLPSKHSFPSTRRRLYTITLGTMAGHICHQH